jgi:ankyrin repeat protein
MLNKERKCVTNKEHLIRRLGIRDSTISEFSKQIIREDITLLTTPLDDRGYYAIHRSIEGSTFWWVEYITEQYAQAVTQVNNDGLTPLLLLLKLYAGRYESFIPFVSNTRAFDCLISCGSDVNAKINDPTSKEDGYTTLHLVRKHTSRDRSILIKLIRAGAQDTSLEGKYLIHEAVKEDDLEMVQALVEKVPNILNQPNASGQTPLCLAVKHNHVSIAEYLNSNGAVLAVLYNPTTEPKKKEELTRVVDKSPNFFEAKTTGLEKSGVLKLEAEPNDFNCFNTW